MTLRLATIDDVALIDKLDQKLFTEIETYPVGKPIFGYYAAQAFMRKSRRPETDLLLTAMQMQFFVLSHQDQPAGFMVLRNWVDESDVSRGRFDARDRELFYLGVAPDFRRKGLGTEALQFALQHDADHNRRRTILARFKPACTGLRHMLERADFAFHPTPQNGRTIGFRLADANEG